MLPPANQAPSGSNATSSSSTTGTTSSIAVRAERDSKRYDRRSDLLCRVRYTNVLPDLPFDPKFLRYPFSKDRFVRYKPTSLEKNYRWELLTEHDVGVEIDLINPDTYISTGKLMKDEEKLLEDESISPANKKRSMLNQRSVPWLRKTEYISTEQSTKRASKAGEARLSSAKEKLLDESMREFTRDKIIQTIEEGFETAKSQLQKHHSKPSVTKVEEWPVFPDFDNWKYPFAQVIFDDDPYPATVGDDDYLNRDPNSHTQEHFEEMSDAVIKAFVDDENKEYIGYFLPTAENKAKRQRESHENEEEEEEEDDTYDFKLIREYTWNRKDKTMRGFEQNYFLVMKEDCVVYNELETRVRLNKRRVDPGVRMAKMRLIQSYRTFNEAEEQNQRKRLKALENEEENEEANEEEEEQQEEGDGDEDDQQQDNTQEGDDDNDDEEQQQQQDDGDDEEADDD